MTFAGVALPMAVAGPIFKPIAVPDGKLGIVAGNVTTKPVEVCDQVSVLALPSNETEPIAPTSRLEVRGERRNGQLRSARRNASDNRRRDIRWCRP